MSNSILLFFPYCIYSPAAKINQPMLPVKSPSMFRIYPDYSAHSPALRLDFMKIERGKISNFWLIRLSMRQLTFAIKTSSSTYISIPTRRREYPRNLRINRAELNSQCGKQFNYETTRPLAVGYGKLKNVIVSDLWFPCGRQILRGAKLHSPTDENTRRLKMIDSSKQSAGRKLLEPSTSRLAFNKVRSGTMEKAL